MKISDIARELDVPEGTVKGRLHDAKSEIKKGIHEMQGGDQSPPRAFLVFFSKPCHSFVSMDSMIDLNRLSSSKGLYLSWLLILS